MAMTINPAVSGGRKRWLARSGIFAGGAFIGAIVTLIAAAAVGAALGSVGLRGLVAAPIALVVVRDLGVPVPVPYRNGQVPEWLREMLPPPTLAASYGFMLGLGFATLYTYSIHLAMVVAVGALASPAQILVCGLVFALGKSISVLAAAGATTGDDSALAFRWRPSGMLFLKVSAAAASLALGIAAVGGVV
jgi:hypothetical protein